jgi:hypothetical protein
LKLRGFQRQLERIYRLDPLPPVERFLMSDEEIRRYVPVERSSGPRVLILEEKDSVFVGVHLGDELTRRIETGGLDLADFASAAEEVSHFLYLLWSARNGRPVSLLDVETQGEIDKFLLASIRFAGYPDLFERIFGRFSLDPGLGADGREMYRQANRLAAKFCRGLGELPAALRRLRSFYRLASPARLSRLLLL